MRLLNGRIAAAVWQQEIRKRVIRLQQQKITPGIGVILVGDDPASLLYTQMKERVSRSLGFFSKTIHLPATIGTETVIAAIKQMNTDPAIHGFFVQLPLPPEINQTAVVEAIAISKDIDGLNPTSLGRLIVGNTNCIPATPKGILRLLKTEKISTQGKHVVIVGRSAILGKPLAALFTNQDATVTICHSQTQNLADFTRMADIVVMDTGVPHLLTASMVHPKLVVIDAGITRLPDGTIIGDVVFPEVAPIVAAITPVPGGVGPMTIAALLDSVVRLTEEQVAAS